MKVAVALIFDAKQRVLITLRPSHASHGGLWEFPGGKVEAGEKATEALVREIREEVGLEILDYQFLTDLVHDYGSKTVQLFFYQVNVFRGEAQCCESQADLRWVPLNELEQYSFPEANLQIIQKVLELESDQNVASSHELQQHIA
jgi:8-oxo-dGTP diphosphatase